MGECLFHRCAVVTGASSGLGAEFARQLAPHCKMLVLVARRLERLEKLASELEKAHPDLEVGVLPADLSDAAERERLVERITSAGLCPDLLVNNAGMGDYGEFVAADWSKLEAMLRLNVEALTQLTHSLVPLMIKAGGGAVLNVSSLASLLPIPDFAVYAATKAYVTSFSEALRIELREHGVRVTALCPGPVHTEFGKVAEDGSNRSSIPGQDYFYVDSEQVVSEALDGLVRDKARVFPGWQIATAAVVLSLVPIAVIRLLMGFRPRK